MTFCLLNFREVYDLFRPEDRKNVCIRMLVERTERQGRLDELLGLIKADAPYQYERYADQLKRKIEPSRESPPFTNESLPAIDQEAYLTRLVQQTRYISLIGSEASQVTGAGNQPMEILTVYTALQTTRPDQNDERDPPRLRSVMALLNEKDRLVLLGEPGSGKTTFINVVALCLAGELLNDPRANLTTLVPKGIEEWSHGPLLPVRVVLRDFAARGLPAAEEPVGSNTLWAFIEAELGDTVRAFGPYLKRILREQGGLILLDGLDEAPDTLQQRTRIKKIVQDFGLDFPRCRLLITTRTYAYQQQDWKLEGFSEATLSPFTSEQISAFIDGLYGFLGRNGTFSTEDAAGRAALLKTELAKNQQLAELAARPLLLTLITTLHANRGGNFLAQREILYHEVVELLLTQWEAPKVVRDATGQVISRQPSLSEWLKLDKGVIRNTLNQLAFTIHSAQAHGEGAADMSRAQLIDSLLTATTNPDASQLRLIEYLRDRSGLLVERGNQVYAFPHRSFQEYLAACHLTDYGYPERVAHLARTAPSRWREVALLAGAKAARGSKALVWALVEALCRSDSEAADKKIDEYWGAFLAGKLVVDTLDLGRLDPWNQNKISRVRSWLVEIIEYGKLPALERAETGRILALLGDPRPGVGLQANGLPDLIWHEVPAGSFQMGGSAYSDPPVKKHEQPSHQIALDGFEISRFPITNAQYRAFVAAGGYSAKNQAYWIGTNWSDRLEKSGPAPYEGRFGLDNHPVVGVTWYEAVAFCRWLTHTMHQSKALALDAVIRLPSEAEWEKAAGAPYPWGNASPTPELANFYKFGLGATNAVGIFPAGASLTGCLDMAGNVWEWTASLAKDYPYSLDDQREIIATNGARILRGGSWYSDQDSLRSTRRIKNTPDRCFSSWGFRVVRAPR